MLKTTHQYFFTDVTRLDTVPLESIDLVLTSPPYPMIEMWDDCFGFQNKAIQESLLSDPSLAFEQMHDLLDTVWQKVDALLKPGGFVCINIGDATRTVDQFAVYPNHSRIMMTLMDLGLTLLPEIIWRKQSNAPNKYLGSGMLPAGAYVTQEHEYILIARKGGKRQFSGSAEKKARRQSAMFWEERNRYFSDIWFDIKGRRQNMKDRSTGSAAGIAPRSRNAAFPFELAYRLINMYSVKGDTVFDPFLGTGTTMAAAITACRNSIGCEIDPGFEPGILERMTSLRKEANARIMERLTAHAAFIKERERLGKPAGHVNHPYGFAVVTGQETDLIINELTAVTPTAPHGVEVAYSSVPQQIII